jgi:hypothetical protein
MRPTCEVMGNDIQRQLALCLIAWAGPASAQSGFDKAMENMGKLHFIESHCSDFVVVNFQNSRIEEFYSNAVRFRPGAFRDALLNAESALRAGEVEATCVKIVEEVNAPGVVIRRQGK